MNVLSPPAKLSLAPTRDRTRSTMPMRAERAGTKLPIWARITDSATCRSSVLLPAMLGPVISHSRSRSRSRSTSLGTKRPCGSQALDYGMSAITNHDLIRGIDRGPRVVVTVRRVRHASRDVPARELASQRFDAFALAGRLRAKLVQQRELAFTV